MNTSSYILALDQGTTSSRAIVFGHDGRMVSVAQQEFPQLLPGPGLVEHDPEAIWSSQLEVARQALPMIVRIACPLRISHAQAVDHDDDARARIGDERRARIHDLSVHPQMHPDLQRIAGCFEMVAEHAVDRSDHRIAPLPFAAAREQRHERSQQCIERGTRKSRDTADAPVNEAREARCRLDDGATQHAATTDDVVVHRFHGVGDAHGQIDDKPAGAPNIIQCRRAWRGGVRDSLTARTGATHRLRFADGCPRRGSRAVSRSGAWPAARVWARGAGGVLPRARVC